MEAAVVERDLEVEEREAESGPLSFICLKPFSTDGMNSFGTRPPTTFDSNTKPVAGLERLDRVVDLRELTGATRLLLVGVAVGDRPW